MNPDDPQGGDPVADALAKMRQPAPSGDPVADALASMRANPDELARRQLAQKHADYRTGALQARTMLQNAQDEAEADQSSPIANAIAAVLPGGLKNIIATGRADLNQPFVAPTRAALAARDARIAAQRQALDQSSARVEAASPRIFGPNVGIDLPFIGNPINPKLTTIAQTALTAPVMAALPGTLPVQAGLYGALQSGLDAPPGATVGQRLGPMAISAALNALLAKGVDLGTTALRAARAPGGSSSVMDLQDVRTTADQVNYGNAAQQGTRYYADLDATQQAQDQFLANRQANAQRVLPPDPITPALSSPGVAPYARIVQTSERFANADPATLLRETYKLMSEAQGKKLAIGDRGEFSAASDFQLKDLAAAKDKLRAVAADVMPDFNPAVDTHRIISGELNANRGGYRAAQQAAGSAPNASALGVPKKDPAAFIRRAIPEMTPSEAAQAVQGIASGVKSKMGVNPLRSGRALQGGTTLLRAADAVAGGEPMGYRALRYGGTALGNTTMRQSGVLDLLQAILGGATVAP